MSLFKKKVEKVEEVKEVKEVKEVEKVPEETNDVLGGFPVELVDSAQLVLSDNKVGCFINFRSNLMSSDDWGDLVRLVQEGAEITVVFRKGAGGVPAKPIKE